MISLSTLITCFFISQTRLKFYDFADAGFTPDVQLNNIVNTENITSSVLRMITGNNFGDISERRMMFLSVGDHSLVNRYNFTNGSTYNQRSLTQGIRRKRNSKGNEEDADDVIDAKTKAVKDIVNTHLEGCSLTFFHSNNFTLAGLKELSHGRLTKVYDMKDDILKIVDTWSRAMCDGYIYFLDAADKDFLHHSSLSHYHRTIHHKHPESLWNYHAYHVIVLLNHQNATLLPMDVLSLYNFKKTAKVIVLEHLGAFVSAWSHQLYKVGSGIKYLGTWIKGRFSGNLVKIFDPEFNNFEGAPLKVATFGHPPSVVYAYDKDHSIVSRLGVDMQIVQTLAKARNFTPEFLEVSHSELWGYELPNGTWTGLVGKVFYELADLGACNVFLELRRWKMMDYSIPYNFERGCFVAPSPKPLLNWQSPVLPFTWNTWMFIGLSLLAGGPILYIMVLLSKDVESCEFLSFSYNYLYILGAMTMRSPNILPLHAPVRLYIGFVWLFCLIISTAYSANLIAFLSVTQLSAPIDTMKQLAESNLRIGGVAFWKTQFTASIDPVVQNFADVLESDVQLSSLFDRVEAGQFALIENKQYLELQAGARYTYGSRTTIRIVRECLLPYSIGVAFQKNSPLKSNFDKVILHLFESGVVQKWKEEVVIYFRQQYKDKRQQKADEELPIRGNPLKLEQLQGVFYVLGVGYILSGIILTAEIVTRFRVIL